MCFCCLVHACAQVGTCLSLAMCRIGLAGCGNYNQRMNFTPISALSPLDGRYASKLNALRPLMSEQGYMPRRVQVEIAWFIALSDAGFDEFKPLSTTHLP